MVTRGYGAQELPPYPRLLRIGSGVSDGNDSEDPRDILTLDELKPHHLATRSIQQHEGTICYNLSPMPE